MKGQNPLSQNQQELKSPTLGEFEYAHCKIIIVKIGICKIYDVGPKAGDYDLFLHEPDPLHSLSCCHGCFLEK